MNMFKGNSRIVVSEQSAVFFKHPICFLKTTFTF